MMLRRQANARVVMAEAVELDAEQRVLTLDRGERIAYDSLIVACGADTSYFGHDEWRDAACPLKTLEDAVALRERIFTAFEEAERAPDPEAQKPLADVRGHRRRADRGRDRRAARHPRAPQRRSRLRPYRSRTRRA